MTESRLIIQLLIPLSASGVTSIKPLCSRMLDTLWAKSLIICKRAVTQT